ncbi:probable DNA-directed RNA polymerase [Andrographis paniculata]|uniref:probable DNA-directed RNA polymerase n=1 Tax=Andrographis paniculata TaxID=175694 RepID=UPI0021E94663|nr:probable DNA-directed RNA polymerase [Andrographis paniculata]
MNMFDLRGLALPQSSLGQPNPSSWHNSYLSDVPRLIDFKSDVSRFSDCQSDVPSFMHSQFDVPRFLHSQSRSLLLAYQFGSHNLINRHEWCYPMKRIGIMNRYENRNMRQLNVHTRKFHIGDSFWDRFLNELEALTVSKESKPIERVVKLLVDFEKTGHIDYIMLEHEIEDVSLFPKEGNTYKAVARLMKMVFNMEEPPKLYMHKKLPSVMYDRYISPLGVHTLEAIILVVLGLAFSGIKVRTMVRAATFIELLDTTIRTQVSRLQKNPLDNKPDTSTLKERMLGETLLSYITKHGILHYELTHEGTAVVKEKGKGYVKTRLNLVCNFEISELPAMLNLPMVCKPVDWHIPDGRTSSSGTIRVSDLQGGYLNQPNMEVYNRISLMSSKNLVNFNIELKREKCDETLTLLNGLQGQAFQINKKLLNFIKGNRPALEKEGLLMPELLARVNPKKALDLMRSFYFQNLEGIQEKNSLESLLMEVSVKIQQAFTEGLILQVASAYEGYDFYLPAFLDFRGRIYRSGILHFHERDLAKSLLLFSQTGRVFNNTSFPESRDIIETSTAFKYQKFMNYEEALKWYKNKKSYLSNSYENIISTAKDASDPFQFMAKILLNEYDDKDESNRVTPISQDASSSAYQIMSYFLLNYEMARSTNLLSSNDNKIKDLYTLMLEEIKSFLREKIDDKNILNIILIAMNRKLVKQLFMPMVYGKTLKSMEQDISEHYGAYLSRRDSSSLARLVKEFFIYKYPDIDNFLKLIATVGWLCSTMGRAVVYSTPFFSTKQDYMSFDKEKITVTDRKTRKKRTITVNIPTHRGISERQTPQRAQTSSIKKMRT